MANRLEFRIADKDMAFVAGLPTRGSGEFMLDNKDIGFDVKVPAGEAYILHVPSDHVIRIINPDDRWFYEHLYAVNVDILSGYWGVFADSDEEAIHMFADYCAEMVPDPDMPGDEKQRYPGLIWDYIEMQDEEEEYPEEFSGPWGNCDWYFTERGHPATARLVEHDKTPPIPPDLFPFKDPTGYSIPWVFDSKWEKQTPRENMIENTFYQLRALVRDRYPDEVWRDALVDYIDEQEGKRFKASVEVDGEYIEVIILDE
jgi:hypothetical protein